MMLQQVVEYLDIAMIGETQVLDATSITLFQEIVHDTVVDEA